MERLKKLYYRVRKVMSYIGRRQISIIAAAAAFWVFLSLVPLMTLVASLLPYTSITQNEILQAVGSFLPNAFNNLFRTILKDIYSRSFAVLSISIVTTLWSAGVGFSNLFRGLDSIYGKPEGTNFFLRRFWGILYTIGMLLYVFVSVALVGYGKRLTALLKEIFPAVGKVMAVVVRFRSLLVVTMLVLFILSIYRWSMPERSKLRSLLPGALFASLGWYAFTIVFSIWVNSGHYATYGSLATVVIVMLWLYYCQYIILLGACINRALPDWKRRAAP